MLKFSCAPLYEFDHATDYIDRTYNPYYIAEENVNGAVRETSELVGPR
jgi:hypothetical protein